MALTPWYWSMKTRMRPAKPLLALAVLLLAMGTIAAYASQGDAIVVIDADEIITTGTSEDKDLSNTTIDPRLFFRWVEQIRPVELLAPASIPQPLDRIFLRYVEHSQKILLDSSPNAPDTLDRIYLGHVEHGRTLALHFPIGLVQAPPDPLRIYLPIILASW